MTRRENERDLQALKRIWGLYLKPADEILKNANRQTTSNTGH